MYTKGDKERSIEEAQNAAKKLGMEVSAWAEQFGWSMSEDVIEEGEPGKTGDSAGEIALVGSGTMTAAGDSSSADTSLEQSNIDILPGLQYAAEKDLFSVDETEGRLRLEAYFKGVPGIVFEEVAPGRDFLQIKYYDQNKNKEFKSERLSFDTNNKDSIAKNMEILSNFVLNNLPAAYLPLIPKNLEKLKEKRSKTISSYITPKFIKSNNAIADNPNLFKPIQETKIIGFSGAERSSGGQSVQVTTYPYEKELIEASQGIMARAKAANISITSEDLKIDSERLVRAQIKNEGILKEKQIIASKLIEDNVSAQGEAWLGTVVLGKEVEGKAKENTQLQIASIEQNAAIKRASSSVTKLIDSEEMTAVEQETMVEDFNALGIVIDRTNQALLQFEDGRTIPEEYYKAAIQLSSMYEANYNDYQIISEEGANIDAEIENIGISLDASRRSYDLGDKTLYSAGLGLGELGLSTAQLVADAKKDNNPILKMIGPVIDVGIQNIQNGIDKSRNQFARDVDFESAFSNPANFGKFALQEIANQIPILLVMGASGGAAAYVAGATSAGSKIIEMKGERMKGDADYSDLEIALKSAGYGLAEGAFAQITTVPILNRAKSTWIRGGKSDVVDSGTKAFFREKSTSLIYEPLLEAGGEVATQGSQNLIDGKPFMEGVDHAGVSGFGFGLIFAGVPFMKGIYSSRNSDYKAKESIRNKQLELDKLAADWKVSQSDADMKRLESQMSKVRQELTLEIEQQENIIDNNLRAEHGEYVIQATERQSRLQNEAKTIQEDPNLSLEQKKNRIENLRTQFDFLQTVKEQSLAEDNMMKARPEFVALQITDKVRFDNLNNEAKARLMRGAGVTKPTAKQIESEAYEIYLRETIIDNNNQAAKTKGANLLQFETQQEAIDAIEDGTIKLPEDDVDQVIANIKGESEGFAVPNGQQVVIVENQMISQNQHIGTHEVGHYVFDKLAKNNPKKFKSIATQLLKSVKSTDAKLYKEFVASIEKESNGDLKSYEVISRFLELVAAKKVNVREKSKARGLAGLFGVALQKEFVGEYNFDFKGEQDIVNFVVGLGQKIAGGTLSTADIIAASENVMLENEFEAGKAMNNVKFSKILTEIKQKSGTAFSLSKNNDFKAPNKADLFSVTTNVFNEAAALFGIDLKLNEDGTPAFTKAEWDAVDDNTKLGIGFMLGDTWRPYVKYLMETRREVPGFDEYANQIIDRASTGIEKGNDGIPFLVKTYNPEAGAKLSTHIFGQVSRRLQGVIDKQDGFGEITVEAVSDKPGAKELVQEESTTAVEETPKYRNLLGRRIVSRGTMNNIKSKIKPIIRVLKTRMDASVSNNVTIKPWVNELRLQLGKQIDIDLKQEMGGVKDGQLRRFLLNNKTAILENMTTSYLAGAMPFAVQKSVSGVYTSNWQGQKIDRETTETGKAGRTSGNELVKRLSRASSRISDAEFLSAIVGPGGNPIRGRKESLAKAIAEELSLDIISEELQNPDSDIAQAFAQNQEMLGVAITENTANEARRDFERGSIKFSFNEKLILRSDAALDKRIEAAEGSRFTILGLKHLRAQNKTNELLNNFNLKSMPSLGDSKNWDQNQKDFINTLKTDVFPLAPKEFFFGPDGGGIFTASASNLGSNVKSNSDIATGWASKIADIIADKSIQYGKPIPGISNFSMASYSTLMKDEATFLKKKKQILEHNKKVAQIHKVIWKRLAAKIKNKKSSAVTIAKFLHFSVNSGTHFHRMGAQIAGYSKDFKEGGKERTFEHAMTSQAAYLYLLDAALLSRENNPFRFLAAYNAVIANYKVIALNKASDKLLTGEYKSGMGPNWNLRDNVWYDRYSNAGIDLNTIIMLDGKSIAEISASVGQTKFSKSLKPDAAITQSELIIQDIANNKKLADAAFSKGPELSEEFNKMIERNTGFAADKVIDGAEAALKGKAIGKYKFFAPGADDFRGLTSYTFAGKGKQGEADQAFFEENLIKPYQRGINAINRAKQTVKNDFAAIVKAFSNESSLMSEKLPNSVFTYDQALRVYMWTRQGVEIPGLSSDNARILNEAISNNPSLIEYSNAIILASKQSEWPAPGEYWTTQTVLSDLNSMSEKIGRKTYLAEFIAAKEVIFSTENFNKLEALYGVKYTEALIDSLFRMENGTNRTVGPNKTINAWLNWINQSTGAIMFFNRRSAVLQLLSTANFINWSDNNPIKIAIAFANQKQFWTDFAMIFNSAKLKERRSGLQTDVSASEIANAAKGSQNKVQAALNYLLTIGFTPTQMADSFAIASGGATFYRNRVSTYLKQGKNQAEAEKLAFEEFSSTADESQQSSDPMLVSQQQAGILGRLILAFQNTPMQYTRLMKKAGQDLINGRGDPKANISKIIYYGAIQNLIFSSLQSALFAFIPGFGDDEDEDPEKRQEKLEGKEIRVINSMIDSLLKGSGLTGAVFATVKNTIMEYYKQDQKGFLGNQAYTILTALSISPPMGSKLRKLYKADRTKTFNKDSLQRGASVVAEGRLNLSPWYSIIGNLASGGFNIPMDRVVDEITSLSEALDSRNSGWQRLALALGWKTWDVGAKNEYEDLLKIEGKKQRKIEGKAKSAATRAENKAIEEARLAALTPAERTAERIAEKKEKLAKKLEAKKNK